MYFDVLLKKGLSERPFKTLPRQYFLKEDDCTTVLTGLDVVEGL